MIGVAKTNCNFEREPLLAPFGFKGGYLSEAWQSIAALRSENGHTGLGLATQSTLWSDAGVFLSHSEAAGNSLMFLMTSHALELLTSTGFRTPIDMLDALLPRVHEYGKRITGRVDLRLTFALNSLVAVDNAAWQLYCAENDIHTFDEMIPEGLESPFTHRHDRLANIPLMSYGVALAEIVKAVDDGYWLLKIKIGSDPDKDGDQGKMLEWDKRRLSSIHEALKDREVPFTSNGCIPYYLDANGRYDGKDRLMRLLDHAQRIGALDRIVLLEEPFPEEYEADVTEIPVRLAADESAHSDTDAVARIDMGYRAIALKPIAKTVSMSLKIARVAHERGIPCFCADLTVSPVLVDWNKSFAARLAPLPGMAIGVIESNGHQNYSNWARMRGYHPCAGASWIEPERGIYGLGADFYASSGGILLQSEHYLRLCPI